MALSDIVAQAGDGQDFILEMPAGNSSYVASDILSEPGATAMCVEVPAIVAGTGGGIFVIVD